MATTNKDLIGIAKGNGDTKKTTRKPAAKKTTRKPAAKKTTAKKPAEPKLTPEQERDLKAKQRVEELLKDADLTPPNGDDNLLELVDENDTETKEEPKGVEWLEEQIQILVDRNKVLEVENEQLKQSGGVDTQGVKESVVRLFDELQGNYLKMGPHPTIPNRGSFVIYTPGFLNRMIKFFPFLEDFRRF